MRASVRNDTTTRIITLEVSGVPDVDITENWHHRDRLIRPDHVTLQLTDGEVREVKASGPVVRKDGSPGGQRGDATWRTGRYERRTLDGAPEWVHTLVREAPEGVTDWGQEVPA